MCFPLRNHQLLTGKQTNTVFTNTYKYCTHGSVAGLLLTWLEKVIKYMKFQNSPDFLQVTVECTCMTNQLEESIVMINLRPFGMLLITIQWVFFL